MLSHSLWCLCFHFHVIPYCFFNIFKYISVIDLSILNTDDNACVYFLFISQYLWQNHMKHVQFYEDYIFWTWSIFTLFLSLVLHVDGDDYPDCSLPWVLLNLKQLNHSYTGYAIQIYLITLLHFIKISEFSLI